MTQEGVLAVCVIHIVFAIPDTGDKVAKESKNDNFIQEKCQRCFQILNEIDLESLTWKYNMSHQNMGNNQKGLLESETEEPSRLDWR